MIAELIYYPDHDKRYAHMSEPQRKSYPDALKLSDGSIVPRVKTIAELFKERRKYGYHEIWFLAVDVPIFRAQKYANQV